MVIAKQVMRGSVGMTNSKFLEAVYRVVEPLPG
jgi:hypothetical protein